MAQNLKSNDITDEQIRDLLELGMIDLPKFRQAMDSIVGWTDAAHEQARRAARADCAKIFIAMQDAKMSEISYEGIDEADLVLALYQGTAAQGMGFLHDRNDLTVDQVRVDLVKMDSMGNGRTGAGGTYHFDYYYGRPLKVSLDLKAKTFFPRLYDRDAGPGAAQAIVDRLRGTNA